MDNLRSEVLQAAASQAPIGTQPAHSSCTTSAEQTKYHNIHRNITDTGLSSLSAHLSDDTDLPLPAWRALAHHARDHFRLEQALVERGENAIRAACKALDARRESWLVLPVIARTVGIECVDGGWVASAGVEDLRVRILGYVEASGSFKDRVGEQERIVRQAVGELGKVWDVGGLGKGQVDRDVKGEDVKSEEVKGASEGGEEAIKKEGSA